MREQQPPTPPQQRPASSSSYCHHHRVPSLQNLAVKRIVRVLFSGAQGGEEKYLQDALGVMQNLGLFADLFLHAMRHLQTQFETIRHSPHHHRTPSATGNGGGGGGGGGTAVRRSSSSATSASSLAFEFVVSRLFPGLLHPRLTVLNLKYDFVRHSAHARAIALTSICRLPCLEKADFTGVCTDELVAQLSLHCPQLRHLGASHSKQLTDAALTALTGALRSSRAGSRSFAPGCRLLRRLEIQHCPLITASKVVSVLLTLPGITHVAFDKLSQVFESSALFESGLQFRLANFEHVVTHLERAREKINHHLRSEDQFLLKVSEIFPEIATVRLTLSHLFDDTNTLRQLANFNNIHTLVLEQPVGNLDLNFREFLLEKGHRLARLSVRVHSANLLDLVCVFQFCNGLRSFQFFSMVLDSSLEDFSLHSPVFAAARMEDLVELCLGCAKAFAVEEQDEQQQQPMALDENANDLPGLDVFGDFFRVLLLKLPRLRSLVLSGECGQWLCDGLVRDIVDVASASEGEDGDEMASRPSVEALKVIRRIVITGKCPLSSGWTRRLQRHCQELQTLRIFGCNFATIRQHQS